MDSDSNTLVPVIDKLENVESKESDFFDQEEEETTPVVSKDTPAKEEAVDNDDDDQDDQEDKDFPQDEESEEEENDKPQQDDSEDDEESFGSKKKRKNTKKGKKAKKAKLNPKEEEEYKKLMKEIGGKKRIDKDEITKEEEEAYVFAQQIVNEIRKATADDLISIEQSKPATAKLLLLKKVGEHCAKPYLQSPLLENGVLEALQEWIRPTGPELKLPNLNIRTGILKILYEIPVKGVTKMMSKKDDFDGLDVNHLKGTEIGKFVKFLSQNPKETQENRKIASTIVERWSRMIFGLTQDYKKLTWDEKPDPKKMMKVEVKSEPSKTNRARIPKIMGFDFVKNPQSKSTNTKSTKK